MTKRQAFTPAMIDALRAGEMADPQTPGLLIERLASGKAVWRYRRRIPAIWEGRRNKLAHRPVKMKGGTYPAMTLGAARQWAQALNAKVESGVDPRDEMRAEQAAAEKASITVNDAFALYIAAARIGLASRAKKVNKPRTILDKLAIHRRDIAPLIGTKAVHDVTEAELVEMVRAKRTKSPSRANRLIAELGTFFAYCGSLDAQSTIDLPVSPARRLHELRVEEKPRSRRLDEEELKLFLRALALEERDNRRGMLLCLLSGCRISEVVMAAAEEVRGGVWIIPGERTKNSKAHRVDLGPWGRSLLETNQPFLFTSHLRPDEPRSLSGWYKVRDRIRASMSEMAGRVVPPFSPHDLRRTLRSNTRRFGIAYLTAEAMLNHSPMGDVERTYDHYDPEADKAAGFLLWENYVAGLAREIGVADTLDISV